MEESESKSKSMDRMKREVKEWLDDFEKIDNLFGQKIQEIEKKNEENKEEPEERKQWRKDKARYERNQDVFMISQGLYEYLKNYVNI